jgi:hypothetical protein
VDGTDEEDLGALMARRAFIQVQAAREASGGTVLDFSLASLATLDQLIQRYMTPVVTDPRDVAEVVGAYVGEVLRRQLGFRWCWHEGRAALLRDDAALDPFERARLRLAEGPRFSLAVYGEAVAAGRPEPETVTAKTTLWRRLSGR